CTVFAPPSAAPGDGFLVQAFAHLREHASQLLEIAGASIIDPKQMGSKRLTVTVERGGELTFFLAMPGLEIDEPTQAITWDGEISSVEFGVTVPETFRPKTLFGTITLSYESVPIGHVKFMFKVAAEPACEKAEPPPAEPPSQSFVRYKQAFISYASEDRAEVLKRVQMLKTVRINFFQDILSLDPGEQWEQILYKYIDESDVIFLFWSSAAKRSQWVERELRHALDRRGGSDVAPPEIVPVILEGPPFVAPPEYLQQLHFGDRFAYFIKAEEEARQPAQQA
ncbi:MAG: toll/interleukin-1 receptor domain-containing protein, partial [Acidobacteriota bacterium]|nr:toll/interleukin-1 receptor domain-containing protein [Acidobacteriota bacterium]